jgi:hypothetical protein
MHRSKQALMKSRPGKCTAGERRIERGGGLECSRLGRRTTKPPSGEEVPSSLPRVSGRALLDGPDRYSQTTDFQQNRQICPAGCSGIPRQSPTDYLGSVDVRTCVLACEASVAAEAASLVSAASFINSPSRLTAGGGKIFDLYPRGLESETPHIR